MARIAGVDLPREKRIDIALAYIYGIGRPTAARILAGLKTQIDPATRVKSLTEDQVGLLNTAISKEYKVEGELRREEAAHIKRHIETVSYRGYRHRRMLPVRGQRTRTNARTRRGRRKTVGSSAKAAPKPVAKA